MASSLALKINALEKILKVSARVSSIIIAKLSPVFGFDTEIFFPLTTPSVYGKEDVDNTYPTTPNINRYTLVLGIMIERLSSDSSLDPYTGGEIYMFVERELSVPRGSKVRVNLKNQRCLFLRVEDTRQLEGLDEALYKKVILVPFEGLVDQGPPQILQQPVGASVVPGGPLNIQVLSTEAGTANFQWYKDGQPLSGVTGPKISIDTVADDLWELDVSVTVSGLATQAWFGRREGGESPAGRFVAFDGSNSTPAFLDIKRI